MAVDNITKLRNLLAELFMFEFAELDFGIYRIMNAKREEIQRFLDNDLLPQVRVELGKVESSERASIEAELQQAIKDAEGLGATPETIPTLPKIKELRSRLAATVNPAALEEEVFSHLATFFRRYYKDGDYLSLRRYKKDVYALPYEGEEVKLHWANADQYYIKSSEHFRDYAFKLPDGRRVRFKLVEANSEQNNNKPPNGKERRFVLVEREALNEEAGDLVIRFEYHHNGEKQGALNKAAAQRILSEVGEKFADWIEGICTKAPTEKEPDRTLLEKHLTDYTARNSFDYFIHKDLRGFLRRELDFFIKSEVMLLDDIEEDTAPRVEQYLAKVRAIRRIARKVIDMLAQLEDFQKKLWLKKKFVVETNYCVTLDRVPEELYPEIAANDVQREEWVRLFAIDELVNTTTSPNYSTPLTVDFLKANPFLVLDTRFFSQQFKARLLAAFDDLDTQIDGFLVNSENFQALNLLLERYQEQVNCIYIDPPYNTNVSEIPYKNNYKHSSWLTLIYDRLNLGKALLKQRGICCTTIDDEEFHGLNYIIEGIFPGGHLGTVVIRNNPQGRATLNGLRVNHEYALFYTADLEDVKVGRLERSAEKTARWDQIDENGFAFLWENFRKTGTESQRTDRPKQFFPIYTDGKTIRIPSMEWIDSKKTWRVLEEPFPEESTIWPIDESGTERVWKWSSERVLENPLHIKVERTSDKQIQVYNRNYLNQEGALPGTWWGSAQYAAGSHGTNLLSALFGTARQFMFPKSIYAVEACLKVAGATVQAICADYFAGSGTTAHAVINLNREDGGERKYILVEMGSYFDEVLKPRILKVVYSKDWKNGKPVSRKGSSHLFKYIQLESYEDALNNLELRRDDIQTTLLEEAPKLREDYMLRYMLDIESRGSASLLNTAAFEHPFSYIMKIGNGSVGETRDTAVDLVETFNYLLGLRVQQIREIDGVVTVQGHNPDGQRVLIIWRDVKQTDNSALDVFFQQQGYTTRSKEFDLIYVNGDNNLQNLRRDDETWKVRVTEEEFQRLMFDVRNI